METTKQELVTNFVKAISEGNAAIFAGAGLSIPAGYVNWKELLRPFAEKIKLDVDKENDLLSIAQYYKNEDGNRQEVNNAIIREFTKDAKQNINAEIITRLPICTYGTTNYDSIIEDSLEENNRKADVKVEEDQLSQTISNRDAIVYKMHGSA